ncbi:diguanylate cyclase (GGDEF)-like protein [Rheinheimera pacifica]|uniref:GGDEF domain-containing protein n=1 Tax=Rheinheimera pacifica TaxID=173990 RepID=UPI002167A2D9|nr:GGDEF domain-containing protein [Rheinheimera pacifica]MCS4307929.1 diguanylate cyclase (GGDEF)-like protein [Rheinheimera pacifica]
MLRWSKLIYACCKTSLLIAGLLYSHFIAAQQTDISKLLEAADELRASDFKKFDEIIGLLSQETAQLSPEQREHYIFLKAYHLNFKGQRQQSIDMLKGLVDNSQSEYIKFKSLSVLINILMISKNYNEVFSYMEVYDVLLQNMVEKDARNHGLGIMSFVFNQVEQFDIGLYYAEKLIRESGGGRYACFGWQFKLEALFRSGDFERFEQFFLPGLTACLEAKQPIYSNIIRSYKIESLIVNDPPKAIIEINENRQEVLDTSYNILIVAYDALLSSAYMNNGQMELAYSVGMQALSKIDSQSINPSVIMLYDTLYRLSKVRGDIPSALEYHEILTAKKQTYSNEKTAGLIAYNLAKADSAIKNQRIALLDKDNEVLSLQKNLYQQEVKQNKLVMLVLSSILVLSTVLAYRAVIGRKRFKKIAEYDQLTGISNRYHFNNQAKVALDYCELDAKPAALILFDLDYFKNINDQYGHAAGDWALQQVVKTCRNFMRNNDVFGRIGGEEFAVVLPGCHADKAALMAEICRDAIATIDTKDSGYTFPLSASFGVSSSDTSGYQLKQLLADADLAMYKAKQSGRDQVSMYAENLS